MTPIPTPPHSEHASPTEVARYSQQLLGWLISNVEHVETRAFSLRATFDVPANMYVEASAYFCPGCDELHAELNTYAADTDEHLAQVKVDPHEARIGSIEVRP